MWYAQKQEKSSFVNNMTTVLHASGRPGLHAAVFDWLLQRFPVVAQT
jgi:hypothetical protein